MLREAREGFPRCEFKRTHRLRRGGGVEMQMRLTV